MNIGLDMMGGDYAPLEAVKGLSQYLSEQKNPFHLTLVGDEPQLKKLLRESKIPENHFTIVHAEQVIDMNEHPTKALKEKPKSSIAIGFHLLASGKTDAFISAGNTGAMLVGALFSIKTIDGVLRPTISSVIPKENGKTGIILDVGLNADCKPEQLNQFAVMGSVYAQHILGIERPRVSLLNVGEEEGKGNILCKETYPLLKDNSQVNFIGNVEGRDIFNAGADVTVCDGYTGNVVLKMAESIYDIVKSRDLHNDEFMHRFAYENYGGTPVLGVSKPVVIGHGISNDVAFSNMLSLAEKMIDTDVCGTIRTAFQSAASPA